MNDSRLFYFPPAYTTLGTLPAHYIETKNAQMARDAIKHGGKDVSHDVGAWAEYDAMEGYAG